MCCCQSPNINGTFGFQWDPKAAPGIRPIDPPALAETDTLLYDEPGRCGGQDSHCHHYRVTAGYFPTLLVRNGSGDERIRLSNGPAVLAALAMLDSNGRYWLLNALYHAQNAARHAGLMAERGRWLTAAKEKRIRVRKIRNRDAVRVTIV